MIDYHKSEFSSPDLVAESKYYSIIHSMHPAFVVTTSDFEFTRKKN